MIGDDGDKEEVDLDDIEDEVLDDDSSSDDEMPDIGGDTVIDVSGELEALVEKLDTSDPDDVAHRREVLKRLEELAEQRNVDLDSTFNFNLDDD